MTFDPNLLAIFAIAIGLLGVVATLIAPRLTREARVFAQVVTVDRIRRSTPAGDLRIEIHHGADLIDQPVFIVRGVIQNIGGRDIVGSHFINPVKIAGSEHVEILSLEATAGKGIDLDVSPVENGWGVQWNMLKPKETVKFLAVVKSSLESVSVRDVAKAIDIEARLRDVKSGHGILSADIRFGATIAMALMVVSVSVIGFLGMRSVESLTYTDTLGVERILHPGEGEYKSCLLKSGPIYFAECAPVGPAAVVDLMPSMDVRSVRVGISLIAFIIAVLVSVFYGAMFAVTARSPVLIRRMLMPPTVWRE